MTYLTDNLWFRAASFSTLFQEILQLTVCVAPNTTRFQWDVLTRNFQVNIPEKLALKEVLHTLLTKEMIA